MKRVNSNSIDIFYDEFTVYESNERVAFENFSENKDI